MGQVNESTRIDTADWSNPSFRLGSCLTNAGFLLFGGPPSRALMRVVAFSKDPFQWRCLVLHYVALECRSPDSSTIKIQFTCGVRLPQSFEQVLGGFNESIFTRPMPDSCILSWLILAPRTRAQTATVGGRIVDQTEQIVSAAQVTVLNTQTNASRHGCHGRHRTVSVHEAWSPDPYHLTIEKSGFKALHIDDLVLTVNQVFTFEAHLELGAVATTTSVKASELPLIELENAQISNLVDSKRI